jgi:hypothetical protein
VKTTSNVSDMLKSLMGLYSIWVERYMVSDSELYDPTTIVPLGDDGIAVYGLHNDYNDRKQLHHILIEIRDDPKSKINLVRTNA